MTKQQQQQQQQQQQNETTAADSAMSPSLFYYVRMVDAAIQTSQSKRGFHKLSD